MTKEEIIKPENLVYKKPTLMNDNGMHYCPGCSHGVVHKLIAEVIEEMGLEDKAVGISPVGCAVFIYNYLDIDWQEAAHGRAPALATAIKRLWPDRLVFTYQGDGDLACIGTAETIHALNRGENITIIFINNAIYGMTGGQMAPTTLMGMKTATCPYGRDPELHGYPLKITEIAAQLEGTAYVTRQSVQSVPAIRKAKKAIRKAFENSMNGNYVYVLPNNTMYKRMTEQHSASEMLMHNGFISIEFSANLAVIKTRPGYASSLAYDIDNRNFDEILGTIAGDDTIMLVIREGCTRAGVKNALSLIIPNIQ